MGASDNTGSQIQAQQQQQQAQINSAVSGINKSFAGFDPKFFQNYYNENLQYLLPQLGNQYQTTNQNLDYSLSDKGITNSSAGQQDKAALNQDYALQKSNVANNALTATNQLEQNVQGQKNALISEAESAASPSAVATQALESASQFQTPSLAAPVSQAFNDFSSQYLAGQQASQLTPVLSSILGSQYNNFGGGRSAFPVNSS